jgi:hypothetical protein
MFSNAFDNLLLKIENFRNKKIFIYEKKKNKVIYNKILSIIIYVDL